MGVSKSRNILARMNQLRDQNAEHESVADLAKKVKSGQGRANGVVGSILQAHFRVGAVPGLRMEDNQLQLAHQTSLLYQGLRKGGGKLE